MQFRGLAVEHIYYQSPLRVSDDGGCHAVTEPHANIEAALENFRAFAGHTWNGKAATVVFARCCFT